MLQRDNNKYQNQKFGLLRLRLWRILAMTKTIGFCVLMFGFICNAYALDLDSLKSSFISGDYKAAIAEGEKILAKTDNNTLDLDKLYYLLGLSYMKTGNYLRASDIFEIIGNEFKKSPLILDAALALGDTFFLRGDYNNAEKRYRDLLNNNQAVWLKEELSYRLSRCAAKAGSPEAAENEKRAILALDLNVNSNGKYAVQVGYFFNNTNAANLLSELTAKGYSAYIENDDVSGKLVYRVKVGKLPARQEAEKLEAKLSEEGYPTKICP